MRSRLSPPSDPLKPRPSSAIIFAGNAVVFLALSLLTQRMIYSFLFAVTFLLFVYEIVALWKQKRTQRGLHRRDYSDACLLYTSCMNREVHVRFGESL